MITFYKNYGCCSSKLGLYFVKLVFLALCFKYRKYQTEIFLCKNTKKKLFFNNKNKKSK